MLNRISTAEGGAGGGLPAAIRAGICGEALYAAIVRFEDKYFPGQRRGFIDPDGAMLKRMQQLAKWVVVETGRAVLEPETVIEVGQGVLEPESKLDILRRNVLNVAAEVPAKFHGANQWTAGDRVQLDRLIALAVHHIDGIAKLKDQAGNPVATLPWWGEVFGKAYVDRNLNQRYGVVDDDVISVFGATSKRYRLTMQFGSPVPSNATVATAGLPALLLFHDGTCYPLRSRSMARTMEAHASAVEGFDGL